jgi:RNA-directed DNA polymerase
MARYISPKLESWIEAEIEGKLGLQINREKTSKKKLDVPPARLDFLGYSFRYDKDLHGRKHRYWNVFPAPKSVSAEKTKLTEMTDAKQCSTPAKVLVDRLNRHLQGWRRYFSYGYPRDAFREINQHVIARVTWHLQRRSQRGSKLPEGETAYGHIIEKLGLKPL